MPRFKLRDRVKILSTVKTPFIDLEGTIQEVHGNDRDITALDRYTVIFEWGEKQVFYDVQLALSAAADPASHDRLDSASD